jgi:hypothetical protein
LLIAFKSELLHHMKKSKSWTPARRTGRTYVDRAGEVALLPVKASQWWLVARKQTLPLFPHRLCPVSSQSTARISKTNCSCSSVISNVPVPPFLKRCLKQYTCKQRGRIEQWSRAEPVTMWWHIYNISVTWEVKILQGQLGQKPDPTRKITKRTRNEAQMVEACPAN